MTYCSSSPAVCGYCVQYACVCMRVSTLTQDHELLYFSRIIQ